MVDLARRDGVELARVGTWPISTGVWEAKPEDFQAAVEAMACPAIRRPGLKIGHTDDRFTGDGEPTVGWIDNLRVDGEALLGDYVGIPSWINDVMASAWPDRSIEGRYNHVCQLGHTHPFVVTGVALLGVTPPGVGTLQSLQDVADLFGVAASVADDEQTICATISSPRPEPYTEEDALAAAAGNADALHDYWTKGEGLAKWADQPHPWTALYLHLKKHMDDDYAKRTASEWYHEVKGHWPGEKEDKVAAEAVNVLAPPTADSSAAEPKPQEHQQQEGDAMSLSELRSRLGLADDADETAMVAAVDELRAKVDAAPTGPSPEQVAAAAAERDELSKQVDLLAGQVTTLSEQVAAANAEKAATIKASVLDAAVGDGKIKPADRDQWASDYDQAPAAVTRVLASIAPGTAVPVNPAGQSGSTEPAGDEDSEFDHLFAPTGASK